MRPLLLAVFLGSALLQPEPAHAQFGKLGTKVAKKAGVVPAGATQRVQTGTVSFDEHVIELTDARVSQFIGGLQAETRMAAKLDAQDTEGIERRNRAAQEAHSRKRDEYDRKRATFDKCAEPEQKRAEKEMDAYSSSLDDPAAMERLQTRIKAAQAKGDMVELRRLIDSMGQLGMKAATVVQSSSDEMQAAIIKKCGEPPVEPADAPEPEPMLTFQDVRNAGLEASGFTDRQYAIMRERILPYLASKGKNSGGMIYSETEAQVLSARFADLAPYTGMVERY
jgi:hypothetical protein